MLTERLFLARTQLTWELLLRIEMVTFWLQRQKVYHAYSPIVIEAMAALDGLQFASDLGYTHVVFEGDCLQLITTLQNGCKILSYAGLIIDNV